LGHFWGTHPGLIWSGRQINRRVEQTEVNSTVVRLWYEKAQVVSVTMSDKLWALHV